MEDVKTATSLLLMKRGCRRNDNQDTVLVNGKNEVHSLHLESKLLRQLGSHDATNRYGFAPSAEPHFLHVGRRLLNNNPPKQGIVSHSENKTYKASSSRPDNRRMATSRALGYEVLLRSIHVTGGPWSRLYHPTAPSPRAAQNSYRLQTHRSLR